MNTARAPPLVWHKHAMTKMNFIFNHIHVLLELWLEQTKNSKRAEGGGAWSWIDEAKLNDLSWVISTFSWLYYTTQ